MMNFVEGLRISWRNIREHTLRSTLTTLGVIIGVAAVITFVTLGASLQADIINTVAGGNAATMYVTATSGSDQPVPNLGSSGQAVFTEHDIDRLHQIQGVNNVVPEAGFPATSLSYENDSVGRQWITVSTPAYFEIRDQEFVAGQTYSEGRQQVVLNEPATRMFEGGNVTVGDTINITKAATREEVNATVVGIVEQSQSGQITFGEPTAQPAIYAPADPFYDRTVTSPSQRTSQRVYGRLIVRVDDPENVDAVQGRVYAYLGEESDAQQLKSRENQFEVTTQEQLVNQIRQVSNTFTAYITGIALISLVVGAIGIANIMLVSVTERIREIGIMKAVGAQNRDVLQLFLIEAVLLGILGSALGTMVGILGGYLATRVIELPLTFQPVWFGVSVLVGMFVGVLAGIYPAWDAANTDPIEALRYE